MISKQPSVSARFALLDRLSRECADAPESRDFAPASLSELERCSLTDGVLDLLAYQEERVREEERKHLHEVEQQARRRADQRAQARKWERDLMEENRRREFALRLEEARLLATEEAKQRKAEYHAQLGQVLAAKAREAELAQEITKIGLDREKKQWRWGMFVTLAAAAAATLFWVVTPSHVSNSVSAEVAALWEQAAETASVARARVAALEEEIQQRAHLSAGEKSQLEMELTAARLELAQAEKANESVDRRPPTTEGPRRLAATPVATIQKAVIPQKASDEGARVASEWTKPSCNAYDPMCFDL
jgi:hypothetical protein